MKSYFSPKRYNMQSITFLCFLNGCHPYTLAFCMGEKEVPIQNIWRTVTEISVTVDVCSGTVKYYILVRGTSEGDKSQSHISHFAPTLSNTLYYGITGDTARLRSVS